MTDSFGMPNLIRETDHDGTVEWLVSTYDDLRARAEALASIARSAQRHRLHNDAELDHGADQVMLCLDRSVWITAMDLATRPLPMPPEITDG